MKMLKILIWFTLSLAIPATASELVNAAARGDLPAVTKLLANGTPVDETGKDQRTGLHAAASNNHVEVARLLIARGANLETLDGAQETPLLAAARLGKVDMVKTLLSHGAKVSHANKDGMTALHVASLAGKAEVIRLLLAHGASLEAPSRKGSPPLLLAATQEAMDVLLEAGANVSVRSNSGNNLLMQATKIGHLGVMERMLKQGADANLAGGPEHLTAMHWAAAKSNVKALRLLLQHGAEINPRDDREYTPLLLAKNKEVIDALLDAGADVQAKGKDGATALMSAVGGRHPAAMARMLKQGVQANSQTLSLAAWYFDKDPTWVEIVRLLAGNGADVNAQGDILPLTAAVGSGNRELVALLLAKGANPNLQPAARKDNPKSKPLPLLQEALSRNVDEEIILMLLDAGADIHQLASKGGASPLALAKTFGYNRVARRIAEAGGKLDMVGRVNNGSYILSQGNLRFTLPPGPIEIVDADFGHAIATRLDSLQEGLAYMIFAAKFSPEQADLAKRQDWKKLVAALEVQVDEKEGDLKTVTRDADSEMLFMARQDKAVECSLGARRSDDRLISCAMAQVLRTDAAFFVFLWSEKGAQSPGVLMEKLKQFVAGTQGADS